MASGILRAWRRIHGGERVFVVSRFPKLFWRNPDTIGAFSEKKYEQLMNMLAKPFIWRIRAALNSRILKPTYPFPAPGRHIIDSMAATLGIALLPKERRPFLYLTRAELAKQSWAQGWVVAQSSSANYWTVNKRWAPGRMQQVVNQLLERKYQVAQLGSSADEPLTGVKDLRDKTSLRDAASILKNARLIVCMEGGLVHLARAVDQTAVVIYTGYTRPEETGYPENVNLRDPHAGAGCWRRDECEHCQNSALSISVNFVTSAVFSQLGVSLKRD